MYLRHRTSFNAAFMSADPFAGLGPTNDPIREQVPTSYNCDWTGCSGEATAPGALCPKCQAEADACDPEATYCHSCLKVQVKAEGDLCAECFTDSVLYLQD